MSVKKMGNGLFLCIYILLSYQIILSVCVLFSIRIMFGIILIASIAAADDVLRNKLAASLCLTNSLIIAD